MNGLLGDRYELADRLGHGGMATVYCARDQKLDRQVAIKLLADNFAGDDDVRRRFSREARLAASLDHPNVVQVYDVGEEDGRPYIVMEYVDGGTVAERVEANAGSLSEAEAVRILCQLCDGLAHAHARKLVHRDIKPQNLLLRRSDDCLKITDFGIARAGEETTRLTRPGKVIGTDRYMAPEQLADEEITPATDVYACGVVADELLPESREPELREVVERCLRRDPERRFSDGRALGEALASLNGDAGGAVMQRIRTQTAPATATRAAETAALQATRATAALTRAHPWRRRAAGLLALGAIAAVGVIVALDSGGSDTPTKAKTQSPVSAPASAVPQSDDPAQQARELAEFLRAQSRSAGATP